MFLLKVGVGSDEITIKSRKRKENFRKPQSIRYSTIVAEDTDSQRMGAKRTVSYQI